MKPNIAKAAMLLAESNEPECLLVSETMKIDIGTIYYENEDCYIYLKVLSDDGIVYAFEGTETIFNMCKEIIYSDLIELEYPL